MNIEKPHFSQRTREMGHPAYAYTPTANGFVWINEATGKELSSRDAAEFGLSADTEDSWPLPANNEPQSGSGNSGGVCTGKVLSAVNHHFGTTFTSANVGTGKYAPFAWPQVAGGTINIDIFPQQSQANDVSPGRYAVNCWTYIIGYGSTLHIPAGPGGLDSAPTLTFSNSQFTAHLDSAFPYNPIAQCSII